MNYENRRSDNIRTQNALNDMVTAGGPFALLKDALVAAAEAAHQQHRQYDGYWRTPEWRVGTAVKDVNTKAGLVLAKGDVVLFRANPDHAGYVFYSVRAGWNVSAYFDSIEEWTA